MNPDSSEPIAEPSTGPESTPAPQTDAQTPASTEPAMPTEESPIVADPVSVNSMPAAPVIAGEPAIETPPTQTHPTALGNKASTIDTETLIRLGHEARRHKKEKKLERIMIEAAQKGHMTSRDASVFVEVSLRTAEVYLEELVSAGRLEKHLAGNNTEYKFVR